MRVKGFTLIEMLVVVTIGGLLIGIGVVSMQSFFAKQKVAGVKNEIINGIRLARNYAVTGQSPPSFGNSLDYVAVTISASGILSVLPLNISSGIGVSYFSKQLDRSGVDIDIVDFGELLFSVPEGKLLEVVSGYTVKPMDAGDTVAVVVTSTSGGDEIVMSVYPAGVVQETVYNAPTPTPT